MNLTNISIWVGTLSFFGFYFVCFYMCLYRKSFLKSGRVGLLWASIFIFFLGILRIVSIFNLIPPSTLRIISGFSATIPLISILMHLYLNRKIEEGEGESGREI